MEKTMDHISRHYVKSNAFDIKFTTTPPDGVHPDSAAPAESCTPPRDGAPCDSATSAQSCTIPPPDGVQFHSATSADTRPPPRGSTAPLRRVSPFHHNPPTSRVRSANRSHRLPP